jgi:hypothetical protein
MTRLALPVGSLDMDLRGNLLVFDYRGFASPASIKDAAAAVASIDPSGFAPILRMDSAVWTGGRFTPVGSMARGAPQFERWPLAFVTEPRAYEWWCDHAADQARRGIVRAAFTDYAQACQWVTDRVRVAAAQARYEQQIQARSIAQSAHRSVVCGPGQEWRQASEQRPRRWG